MAEQNLMKAIVAFMDEGRTGTVLAAFDDNSIGRVYLSNGVIVSARYRNQEGLAALELAADKTLGSVRFHDNTDIVRSSEVLSSISELLGVQNNNAAASSESPAQAPAATATAGAAPGVVTNPLSELGRRRLTELLGEYIGPVAPLVMADLAQNISVEEALNIVVREIEDTNRAAEFVDTARQFLT